jgi:beta-glucosidase
MMASFRLGMFDPDSIVDYAQIPYQANCSDYNRSLARKAAQESIVSAQEQQRNPPVEQGYPHAAYIGPNAASHEALVGNYNGIPKDPVSLLEGIKAKLRPDAAVLYAEGSDLATGMHNLVPIPSRYFRTPDGRQGVQGAIIHVT